MSDRKVTEALLRSQPPFCLCMPYLGAAPRFAPCPAEILVNGHNSALCIAGSPPS